MYLDLIKEVGLAGGLAFLVINQLFAVVRKTNTDSREDYQTARKETRELETKIDAKLDHLTGQVAEFAIINTKLTEQLGYSARRDVEFYDRQLPAILKRAAHRDFRIDQNRDAINEVRAHLGMPLTSHTPPFGVPVLIDDSRGHSVSALDAVKGTKED